VPSSDKLTHDLEELCMAWHLPFFAAYSNIRSGNTGSSLLGFDHRWLHGQFKSVPCGQCRRHGSFGFYAAALFVVVMFTLVRATWTKNLGLASEGQCGTDDPDDKAREARPVHLLWSSRDPRRGNSLIEGEWQGR
jgi:hypothetical protein